MTVRLPQCIIFLDIDGVLNRRSSEVFLEKDCVEVLNRILFGIRERALEPRVVLTSWHRRRYDARGITKRLVKQGYVGPLVAERTPMLADGAQLRGQEILAWLDAYNSDRVLVLDDDYDAGEGPLRAHHVMPTDGLTDAHVGEALTRAEAPWTMPPLKQRGQS